MEVVGGEAKAVRLSLCRPQKDNLHNLMWPLFGNAAHKILQDLQQGKQSHEL